MTETLNLETGELTRDLEDEIAAQMSDDDDPGEPEPEPDPDEPGDEQARRARASSEQEIEKALQKLAAEKTRHANRVREIMGDDADGLAPCELCLDLMPGFRWDRSPEDATVAKVRVVIGMPDLSNFRPSATEHVCDDCAGLGKVRTGSTVPRYETADCDACAGKGYVKSRDRLNTAPPEAPPVESGNGEQPAYDDGIKRDMFGTPEGDPDYGLMPNMRARPTDYWQTNRA